MFCLSESLSLTTDNHAEYILPEETDNESDTKEYNEGCAGGDGRRL